MPSDSPGLRAAERTVAALARGVLGDGYAPEVTARTLAALEGVACRSERAQVLNALRALDTRAGALVLTGRPVPVSWLAPSEAEAVVQRWQRSAVAPLRRLAAVVTSLALTSLYGHPGPEWDRIGYPGPLGPPPETPRRLDVVEIERNERITCDVVVVGSGAGGGCAAAVLAAAGLDVVVVEKGGYRAERDFTHVEADATRDLYLYGMTLATTDLACRIIAGSTVGGGTVVNYTTSLRTPPFVLDEWRRVSGVDAFTSGEFDAALDAVSRRLGVNTDSSAASRRDEVMEQGLEKLGWHVDTLPRAVRGCTQDEACGYCGLGCRIGAKQSSMRTFLEDAAAAGARIFAGADARRIVVSEDRAAGVVARRGRHRLTVHARAVVVAAGAIETPALLLRSGLRGQVGRNLHLHPGTAAFGVFDDDVRVWEGTLQARYSHEQRDRDGGYGPIFETVPVHPGAGSAALPWTSAAGHRALMERFGKISFCAVLPRDESAGRVTLGRDGSPRVSYVLGPGDRRRIADGVVAAGKVMEAAGAREVRSPHSPPVVYVPGPPGAHERWAEDTRRAGYAAGVTFFSYHQMGSCRMGVDPATSAIDAHHESHELRGLYVMDASAFPTASGVNPMLTIYGLAHRAAAGLARRLS
ncbi:MAG TPA: GMC family oxidoreductase N-terminal domain-containing protein [Actinomycetota bacterium]|nr:GMC family oxidoreductase N-terminal domain-containing protein [Actinomycetota bacterium]